MEELIVVDDKTTAVVPDLTWVIFREDSVKIRLVFGKDKYSLTMTREEFCSLEQKTDENGRVLPIKSLGGFKDA